MSLFPAYGQESDQKEIITWSVERLEGKEESNSGDNVSPAAECRLLASDSDSDESEPPPAKRSTPVAESQDFYLDTKQDYGNLRVSTLYYPGRPEYKERKPHHTLGLRLSSKRKVALRYFSTAVPPPDDTADIAARTQAIQRMLTENPRDLALWLRFIRMQESWVSVDAALSVAQAACSRLPRCLSLHALRLELMAQALSNNDCIDGIRKELATEKSPRLRLLLWQSLICVSARGGSGAARGVAGAALADLRQYAPILLYTYGSFLSAADLTEQLVQLVELSLALTFPQSPHFPPPVQEYDEGKLEEYEDRVISSGLPLGVSWSRVERARAAAHWRPSTSQHSVDPQRCPPIQETADLLPPIVGDKQAAWLCLTVLRLAKVPYLPLYPISSPLAPQPLHSPSEVLLSLLASSFSLPSAHPARPPSAEAAGRVLAKFLEPPNYFAEDDFGYKAWLDSLFDACIAWQCDLKRVALISLRLRLLRARSAVASADALRRLRSEARKLLKGETHPLLFAELAELELRTGPEGYEKAVRAASVAAHASFKLSESDVTYTLYCARILYQVLSESKSLSVQTEGVKALVSAVLAKPVAIVDQECMERAREICESHCNDLIQQYLIQSEDLLDQTDDQMLDITDVLLPNCAEWAKMRVMLATEKRREEIVKMLIDTPQLHDTGAGCEQSAMFGVATAESLCKFRPQLARILHTLYPNSPYIQLLNTEVRVWSRMDNLSHLTTSCAEIPTCMAAAARIMPILLNNYGDDAKAMSLSSLALSRGSLSRTSVSWLVHVNSASHSVRAVDALPYAKWILVQAGNCGGDPVDIQALLLERLLRLRVLLDELRPIS